MPRAKSEPRVTPFSHGKFERFCAGRGTTPAKVAQATGITSRTVQRWMIGASLPFSIDTWEKLAAAFQMADGEELLLAYAEFLKASRQAPAEEAAQQPEAYGKDPFGADAVQLALRPLNAILEFDIPGAWSKDRRKLLTSSRGKLFQIASMLELEYNHFRDLTGK